MWERFRALVPMYGEYSTMVQWDWGSQRNGNKNIKALTR